MVDNVNPTSQFHPVSASGCDSRVRAAETGRSRRRLSSLGIDPSKIDADSMKNIDLSKARTMARNNGGLVLGGLAALAIGAGLMRGRR